MKPHVVSRIVLSCFVVMLVASSARAQTRGGSFEVGAQVTTVHSSEFDASDIGIGGRFGWRPGLVGLEAELSVFPSEFPGTNGFSGGRVEGLFGVTAGPTLGRLRPFASVKPGFARFQAASEPIACIAIFPPPLSCQLSAGRTLFAMEIGGGLDIAVSPRTFVRVGAGDRLLRYRAIGFGPADEPTEDAFFSHDFRFTAGGGLRF